MTTAVILTFSSILMVLFMIVGTLIGWTANDFLYAYMNTKSNLPQHPEMYDEDGMVVNEELLSVRFVDEEDPEEDGYY
jgi:hypothetical protein|tara:strand:+ start:1696 stop:1929 length:234 start_codon:yes stop_codon:yes gene_type:complete